MKQQLLPEYVQGVITDINKIQKEMNRLERNRNRLYLKLRPYLKKGELEVLLVLNSLKLVHPGIAECAMYQLANINIKTLKRWMRLTKQNTVK